jgi:regulatory protein
LSDSSDPCGELPAARETALRLLERTRRTRADLERRLKDRGFAPAVIEDVLDRLAAVGLVDDAEYARAWLAGRWGRRPSGWRRLEGELRAKGISADDIAAGRARLEQEQGGAADEVSAARRLASLAERRYRTLEPRLRQRRLYALLARRGFDGDVIRAALAVTEGVEAPDAD